MGIYMKSRLFDADRSTAMIARMLPSARLALAGILVLLSALPAGIAPAAAETATTFRWRWMRAASSFGVLTFLRVDLAVGPPRSANSISRHPSLPARD